MAQNNVVTSDVLQHYAPPLSLLETVNNALPTYQDKQRILAINWQTQKVWIKRRIESKKSLGYYAQFLLAKIFTLPILTPTHCLGGSSALKKEALRLLKLSRYDCLVPEVIAVTNDWIAISSVGIDLRDCLKQMTQAEQLFQLLTQAIEELARLHHKGLTHGAPYLKNIIYHAEKKQIGFIDFEEHPEEKMQLQAVQTRDLFLFLWSTITILEHHPHFISQLYKSYSAIAPQEIIHYLNKTLKKTRFLKPFLHILPRQFGKDVRKTKLTLTNLYKITTLAE